MSLIGPEGRKQLKLAGRFLSAGVELAASIVVGYIGGGYLDKALDTAPYLSFVGLFLGIAAGFRVLYKLAKTAQQQAEHGSDNDQPPPTPPA
jgi:ATP synthase protein I